MYIQITTRCNMTCAHCCFDCGPIGKDMSEKNFEAACNFASDYGDTISIGGGEPTLHKQFWKFIGIALSYSDLEEVPIWLATNGSLTKTALALARMAKSGIIQCELSQDDYHDEIEDCVIDAFSKNNTRHERNMPTVRNTSENGRGLIAAGRAVISHEMGLLNHDIREDCPCSDLFVTPDGKIWHCGCKTKQYGTIQNPRIPDEYWENPGECVEKVT